MKQLRRQHVFNFVFNNFDQYLEADERIGQNRLARAAAEHFRDLGFDSFESAFGAELPNAMITLCVAYIAEAYNSPFSGTPPEMLL